MSTSNFKRDTEELVKSIRENAFLGALAINAAYGRKEDDVSEIQACKDYGYGWIRDRLERGMIHFNRVGGTKKSTKYFSRFEIETLKRAEKKISAEYQKAADQLKLQQA